MRQLLILGFHCGVYQREPLCRVYVNDVLLDEFDIPQSDRVAVEIDQLDPLRGYKRLQNFTTNPPFLKYIEFDDAGADSLDVVLRIQNDDNNYANGFMSKHTHVTLSHVSLTSKKVLENIDNLTNNSKFTRQNWEKYNRDIVDYYAYDNRHQIFKNFVRDTEADFPGIQVKSKEYVGGYRISTSGHYRLTVKKKLGFWRASRNCSKGIWALGNFRDVQYLYDKYKQYEDQRNSNT